MQLIYDEMLSNLHQICFQFHLRLCDEEDALAAQAAEKLEQQRRRRRRLIRERDAAEANPLAAALEKLGWKLEEGGKVRPMSADDTGKPGGRPRRMAAVVVEARAAAQEGEGGEEGREDGREEGRGEGDDEEEDKEEEEVEVEGEEHTGGGGVTDVREPRAAAAAAAGVDDPPPAQGVNAPTPAAAPAAAAAPTLPAAAAPAPAPATPPDPPVVRALNRSLASARRRVADALVITLSDPQEDPARRRAAAKALHALDRGAEAQRGIIAWHWAAVNELSPSGDGGGVGYAVESCEVFFTALRRAWGDMEAADAGAESTSNPSAAGGAGAGAGSLSPLPAERLAWAEEETTKFAQRIAAHCLKTPGEQYYTADGGGGSGGGIRGGAVSGSGGIEGGGGGGDSGGGWGGEGGEDDLLYGLYERRVGGGAPAHIVAASASVLICLGHLDALTADLPALADITKHFADGPVFAAMREVVGWCRLTPSLPRVDSAWISALEAK